MSISTDAAPRCQHIKDDGVRCKSPALTGFDLCYWHHRARLPKIKPTIPLLDNENAVQTVIEQTLRQLQDGTIETKRATAMFYGLTLAMQNVNKLRSDSSSQITSTLTPAMISQWNESVDVCHPERGRKSEAKDPISDRITQNVSELSDHDPSAPSAPSRPPRGTDMSPDLSRFIKKVLRAGPSHPKFAEVSRIYDRYISSKQTG